MLKLFRPQFNYLSINTEYGQTQKLKLNHCKKVQREITEISSKEPKKLLIFLSDEILAGIATKIESDNYLMKTTDILPLDEQKVIFEQHKLGLSR